ncbi:MAG: hypothetical protein JWM34_1834 [Ilumatobacteraceae bacterium]|nr:hypothetical protein [Ilumatobacteraceae bacterium]
MTVLVRGSAARRRSRRAVLAAVTGAGVLAAGCGSAATTRPITTRPSTTAGTFDTNTCTRADPLLVAGSFLTAVEDADVETYDDCIVGGSVTAADLSTIASERFSPTHFTGNGVANTYVASAADGSTIVITLAQRATGRFAVASVAFPP